MISDPRSTPHSLTGKISFGVITALIAFYLRYFHFESYFLYYSLFIASFFTPLLNKTFHQNAARFEWAKA
jgi:Na+-translocating ferredoxin:NAD+ oxidoreductase RnfD subunit